MPAPAHQGFVVPNAQDASKPALAEPDAIDFNALGNARWGVISGGKISVASSTATNTPAVVLINGVLVDVPGGQNTHVGSGGTQDRFDLVCADTTGTLVTIPGTASVDPVFPDPPTNVTMLAAVMCTAGGGDYSLNVIDKRVMIADSLKTKLAPASDLLVNRNGSGTLFKVIGDGTMSWNDDVTITRIDAGTLRISDRIKVDDSIVAGGAINGDSLSVTNRVLGRNLRNGDVLPLAATGVNGDIFTSYATGKAYLSQNGNWEEIATTRSANPVGTVLTSLQPPSYMRSLGWVALDGTLITEPEAPALFTVPALIQYISTPPSGPRTMQLPDARRRVLMYSPDDIGRPGGLNSFNLVADNLPRHRHNVATVSAGAYSPQARMSRSGTHGHTVIGGAHGHDIVDPGHQHHGADNYLGGGFIVAQLYGQNKIDALFNDRSHTYSVEMTEWTRAATSNITVSSSGSSHQHEVYGAGDHDHVVTIDAIGGHVHPVTEDYVGQGAAVAFTPAYLAVYCYIKS